MLLRRITEHVKAQNWTAVSLDFVIVVVGVFIGIQVANWNDVRQDRVDEPLFLERLHEDIMTAQTLSERLRFRRLEKQQWLTNAARTLFDGDDPIGFGENECLGIAASHIYNINAANLPAFTELVSTGRLAIIRDENLRAALVTFQQARDALEFNIGNQDEGAHSLPSRYPALIKTKVQYDHALAELNPVAECDLESMRQNQAFLNDFTENVDAYDAYVRDGLKPWSVQFDKLHILVDAALIIEHGAT